MLIFKIRFIQPKPKLASKMRKRFELQYNIGQKRIGDVLVDKKCRDDFPKFIIA
jgi:hypothetical protein